MNGMFARIKRFIDQLESKRLPASLPLPAWSVRRSVYEGPESYRYIDQEAASAREGDWLIDSGMTIFMESIVQVPSDWTGREAGLLIRPGAAGIPTMHEALVRLDGVPYHGIDRNRSYVPLPAKEDGRRTYKVEVELFNPAAQALDTLNRQNEPAEYAPAPLRLLQSELVMLNRAADSLLFTMKVYYEAALLLPDGDMNKTLLGQALLEAADAALDYTEADWQDEQRLADAEARVKERVRPAAAFTQGKLHLVGQSHIDLAWLWPAKEAVRKCSRTFSTMSTLLDEFPSFTYAQSQPQAYAYVKQYYPELYERVKRHIEAGRWELVGGMWVEPDLNIPSGESLVRQLLYGMAFYSEEFGRRPRIEWLPDTFGYCASLPQLLRKAGIDYFMTTKMNWNDTNAFPYDLFRWKGIDGTDILAYVCHGINEYTHPKELRLHWDSYKQKAEHPEQMLLYGHGDGGGGVTREMLQYASRSEALPGLPAAAFSTAHDFFDRIAEAGPSLPTWQGDMYLELHRGTYTTHARNKRWNRKSEALFREAEVWGALAALHGADAGADRLAKVTGSLEQGWKKLLFNQFHDIIPGTSIPDVYVKSREDYEEIRTIGEDAVAAALNELEQRIDTRGEGVPLIVFNSLSWNRSETVTLRGARDWSRLAVYDEDGRELRSDVLRDDSGACGLAVQVEEIPQMGYRTLWLREMEREAAAEPASFEGKWETDYYKAVWNERGELVSLCDKRTDRELIPAGECANQLQLFHDRPLVWDAWDIDPRFEQQPAATAELLSAEVAHAGAVQDVIRMKWKLSESVVEQDMIFYRRQARIDFATRVDWRESHKLLKVSFPVEVLSSKATYEIPFGAIERMTHTNTSWESAQFEVCGHRWADLSEGGYGVALLNDCKYGYDVKGNRLRLSLLRAPKWPDPGADQGEHQFVYSLYPHEGDWRDGEVVKRGFELNHPVPVIAAESHEGALPPTAALIETVSRHTVVDTVKPAESGDGVVVRLYEASGGRERAQVTFAAPVDAVHETNLLEEEAAVLPVSGGAVTCPVSPYEVKTIKLYPKW